VLLAAGQQHGLARAEQFADARRDHISARAWLEDASNSLGYEQVRAMNWTPYVGPLRIGFRTSTTWIRLKIDAPSPETRPGAERQTRLVLRIQPGHLDEIALFDPRYPDQEPQLAGDLHDWRLSAYRSFNQNLVIAAPTETIEVFLRLRTQTHHGIHVEALQWDEALARDRQQQLIIGAVIIFLLIVLAWAVTGWLEKRERVIGAFIIHQLISVIFAISLLGFFRVYLSDWLSAAVISHMTSAMFSVTTTAVLWFHWHLLREFKPPALGMRLLQLLMVVTPLTLLLMLAGLMTLALQAITLICTFSPALLLLLACFIEKPAPGDSPKLSRLRLIMVYGAMCLILASATLPALGWLPSPPWAMYSAIGYGLVSAAVLFGALRTRSMLSMNELRKQKHELEMAEKMLAAEREKRREQEQFMTMLTHELTNALATAHLALGGLPTESSMRARGYRAVESMRDIIRRCSQSSTIENSNAAPQIATVDIRALLEQMCNQMEDRADIFLKADADVPSCDTDPKMLSIVLSNLLDNALKYRANASTVEVTVAPCSRGHLAGLQVSVRNLLGDVGRPEADQVFKKYWRSPGAARYAGSGLGLYLSSMIASHLRGQLHYRPEDSHVRFDLWLPI
jgi:signal transduction histidine kinase